MSLGGLLATRREYSPDRPSQHAVVLGIVLVFVALVVIASGSANIVDGKHLAGKNRQAAWESVRSGWLYVLDSTHHRAPGGQILIVDPQRGVANTFPTLLAPEMVLSPDGRLLYVVSGPGGAAASQLEIVDTRTGLTTKRVEVKNRWINQVHSSISTIEVSPNGRWVFLKKVWLSTPHLRYVDDYSIAIYDTERGVIDREIMLDKDCGGTLMFGAPTEAVLHVVCLTSNMVRSYDFSSRDVRKTAERQALTEETWPDTMPRTERIRTAVMSPDHTRIIGVTGAAGVIEMELPSLSIVRILPAIEGMAVHSLPAVRGADALYFPMEPVGRNGVGWTTDVIGGVMLDDLARLPQIRTADKFRNLAMDPAGKYLYATNLDAGSVIVIDILTGKQINEIQNVGETPGHMIVAP